MWLFPRTWGTWWFVYSSKKEYHTSEKTQDIFCIFIFYFCIFMLDKFARKLRNRYGANSNN